MNFFVKTLLKRQLKGLPDDQIEMFITIIEKNPELFKKIAEEIQAKINQGMGQQDAAMKVMESYRSELKAILKPAIK
jgi:hypothetical protein